MAFGCCNAAFSERPYLSSFSNGRNLVSRVKHRASGWLPTRQNTCHDRNAELISGGDAIEQQLRALLDRFLEIHGVHGVVPAPIPLQFKAAPHTRPGPLRHERGVYLFFRDQEWLRIGQTGYSPRFTSQHYGTRRAGSTFARDVWTNRNDFGFDGAEEQVGDWIFQNIGRANIRIPNQHGDAMTLLLEVFLHVHLNPRFEGRR